MFSVGQLDDRMTAPDPPPGHAGATPYLMVPHVDAAHARLMAEGATGTLGPETKPWGAAASRSATR
jgi:uncharacterized glyoxalase superfamily protein PhnB